MRRRWKQASVPSAVRDSPVPSASTAGGTPRRRSPASSPWLVRRETLGDRQPAPDAVQRETASCTSIPDHAGRRARPWGAGPRPRPIDGTPPRRWRRPPAAGTPTTRSWMPGVNRIVAGTCPVPTLCAMASSTAMFHGPSLAWWDSRRHPGAAGVTPTPASPWPDPPATIPAPRTGRPPGRPAPPAPPIRPPQRLAASTSSPGQPRAGEGP